MTGKKGFGLLAWPLTALVMLLCLAAAGIYSKLDSLLESQESLEERLGSLSVQVEELHRGVWGSPGGIQPVIEAGAILRLKVLEERQVEMDSTLRRVQQMLIELPFDVTNLIGD